jgi:hypothetical protein
MHDARMYMPARSLALPVLAAAAVLAAAGCGGTTTTADDASLAPDPPHGQLMPQITGPRLVKIEQIGGGMGTHDIVTVGRNGSATIIKAYGGGGFAAEECRLGARALAALTRDVRRLPFRGRIVRRPIRHDGMYVPKPSFIVDYGRDVETFALSEMPADAAPFVEHLKRMISAREGRCTRVFEQYR